MRTIVLKSACIAVTAALAACSSSSSPGSGGRSAAPPAGPTAPAGHTTPGGTPTNPAAGTPEPGSSTAPRPPGIPFDGPSVWLAIPGQGGIVRVSADGSQQVAIPAPGVGVVTYADGAVWALASGKLTLQRIDPATNQVTKTISLKQAAGAVSKHKGGSSAVDFGLGAVWAIVFGSSKLFRVDPTTGDVRSFDLGGKCEPSDVAVAGKSVWVAMHSCAKRPEPSVYQVNPNNGKVSAPIQVGAEELDGTADALLTASLGTAGQGSGVVIDPNGAKALRLVGGAPSDVAITGHTVWWPIEQGIAGVGVVAFRFAEPRGADPKSYPSLKSAGSVQLPGVRAVIPAGDTVWAAVDQKGIVPIDVATAKAGKQISIPGIGYVFSGQMTFG